MVRDHWGVIYAGLGCFVVRAHQNIEHGAVTKLAFIVLVRKHGEGD